MLPVTPSASPHSKPIIYATKQMNQGMRPATVVWMRRWPVSKRKDVVVEAAVPACSAAIASWL